MNKKICLIGNNKFGADVYDGQRLKVRTYKSVLEQEGFDVTFVELENAKIRLFKILREIKKGIKNCDVVVLITSDNGEKILIPYINKINKKYKKHFVFSQIGTSFLYKHIKNLSEEEKYSFFHNHDFCDQHPDKKEKNNLKAIDVILAETDLIKNAFSSFYNLNNCYKLTNFRNYCPKNNIVKKDGLSLIYLSRVTARKGIFDLINCVKELGTKANNISLDIYGELSFDSKELKMFNDSLDDSIRFLGPLSPENVIETIQKYKYLCFPTKCEGEGTPGCIIESFIAGVPVISSSFTQANELLKENVNSIIYEFNNVDDLSQALKKTLSDELDYSELQKNALAAGKIFTYEYNRSDFLKYIVGE